MPGLLAGKGSNGLRFGRSARSPVATRQSKRPKATPTVHIQRSDCRSFSLRASRCNTNLDASFWRRVALRSVSSIPRQASASRSISPYKNSILLKSLFRNSPEKLLSTIASGSIKKADTSFNETTSWQIDIPCLAKSSKVSAYAESLAKEIGIPDTARFSIFLYRPNTCTSSCAAVETKNPNSVRYSFSPSPSKFFKNMLMDSEENIVPRGKILGENPTLLT